MQQDEIHIRAFASGLPEVFGHHAAQFTLSAAGPQVREARLTADDAQELMACCGLVVGPKALDSEAHELHDARGKLVGLVYAPAKVIEVDAFKARQLRRAVDPSAQ